MNAYFSSGLKIILSLNKLLVGGLLLLRSLVRYLGSYLHLLFSLQLTSFNDNKVNPVNLGYAQRCFNVFAFYCLLLVVKCKMKTSCRTFSPEAACEVIEAEKHSHVFFEAEQDIWMVLVQFCSKQYILK